MIHHVRYLVAAASLATAFGAVHAADTVPADSSAQQTNTASAQKKESVQENAALAAFLLEHGQQEAACTLLREITQPESRDAERWYLLAHCSVALKDNQAAVAYYNRVIELLPNAPRPRAELATLLARAGQAAAASQLYAAAARLTPSAEGSSLMNKLAEQLGVDDPAALAWQQTAGSWAIEAYAGTVYDDNVNGGPVSNVVPVVLGTTPVNFTLAPEAMPRSSYGAAGSLSTTYLLPLNQKWSVLFQSALAGTRYFSESNFSNHNLSLAAAFIYRYRGFSASVQPNLTYQWYDGSMLEASPGVVGRISTMLSPTLQGTTSLAYQQRSIKPDHDRDSDVWSGSFGLIKQLSRAWQLGGEYELLHENADEDIYSRQSHGPNLYASYAATPLVTVIGNYRYASSDYKERMALFAAPREDKQQTAAVTLLWDISSQTGRSTVVRAQYTHMDNQSNIAYNEHKRNIVSVGVQTRF